MGRGAAVRGGLRVSVVKSVPAAVAVSFVRGVLEAAARVPEVAARLPADGGEVAVRLTGDRELRRLNRGFLGQDAVTDVLSFAGVDAHLGDLAVSWPAAVRQSSCHGHAADAELALLLVHGLLHLLGWDHAGAAPAREMRRLTVACLRAAGVTLGAGRI